jgi:hypothetical protein
MNRSAGGHYFKLAADQGFVPAHSHCGTCLWDGVGVPMDKSAGAEYFKLSADRRIIFFNCRLIKVIETLNSNTPFMEETVFR